jgi:pre-mRNA-processing factor 17
VWEWGIPVEIKEIREPYLHSMPVMAPHPTDPWIITQSMDNQILVVSTKDKFRMNKKKRFLGHLVAGYACQVT